MTTRGKITEFIVNSKDFFTARTDRDCVRIGMVGGTCFDIPHGHAYYERVTEAANESDVEDYFDELMDAQGFEYEMGS